MSCRLVLVLLLVTTSARAEVPSVVADIGPVHSMVARVMDGVGEPILLVPAGVSPHGHAMRPSEADALSRADVVFWVGEALAPWMGKAVGSLAADAISVELLEVSEGPVPLSDEEIEHVEEIDADHADDHDHDHGDIDPHGWLDPMKGKLWLAAISDRLALADPENAIIYQANAEAGQAELDGLAMEIREALVPVQERGFITFHDAYSSFVDRFDLNPIGAISVSDAVPPSAGQVADLRASVLASDAVCVFSEPQFDPGLVETLVEGTSVRTGVLDPLGAALRPSIDLYPTLLRNLTTSLVNCLTD